MNSSTLTAYADAKVPITKSMRSTSDSTTPSSAECAIVSAK
ncbi:MAG: hypothetical protein OXC31_05780 [Spirochaetaceae bacterium]|nr:hypothetical protein [Spirochaetaceae bacterium]